MTRDVSAQCGLPKYELCNTKRLCLYRAYTSWMSLFATLALACAVTVTACLAADLRIPLSRIGNADKSSQMTVSGISSGGYMAVQMHVAHSKSINGSAIFAGGPFYCAESNLEYAQYKCMDNTLGLPETQKLVALTYTDASLGLIDPPLNLANNKVYLFSGKADTVVKQPVGKALHDYYESFQADVAADFNVEAEHCLPTLAYGEECATLSSPYLGKCGFDGAASAAAFVLRPAFRATESCCCWNGRGGQPLRLRPDAVLREGRAELSWRHWLHLYPQQLPGRRSGSHDVQTARKLPRLQAGAGQNR